MKGNDFMKFLKNRKFAAAALCALLLAAGGQVFAAEPLCWTADKLTSGAQALSTMEGTVEDFAVDDKGNTVWQVRRAGDAEDAPLVNVTVTKGTKSNFEGNVANGDFIIVEYREGTQQGSGSTVLAERVSKRAPLPQIVVSGEIVSLEGDSGFLLRPFGAGAGGDTFFHCGADTERPAGKDSFRVGDRVTVVYNGILTRSLPPQGFAQIISMFDAPAAP